MALKLQNHILSELSCFKWWLSFQLNFIQIINICVKSYLLRNPSDFNEKQEDYNSR